MPLTTGKDLERWRLANQLSKHHAAKAFGIQVVRWKELTKDPEKKVTDKALCRIFKLYEMHPEFIPAEPDHDVLAFYTALGFDPSSTKDMEVFGDLIGRSSNNIYRILHYEGNPSQVINRYISGILRFPKEKRLSMMKKVSNIADE